MHTIAITKKKQRGDQANQCQAQGGLTKPKGVILQRSKNGIASMLYVELIAPNHRQIQLMDLSTWGGPFP